MQARCCDGEWGRGRGYKHEGCGIWTLVTLDLPGDVGGREWVVVGLAYGT